MQEIFVKNLIELEQWLEKNVEQKDSVWLVHYKFASGLTDITRENLVDTLLCFGWIDSLPGKVDETKTKIRISPRNPKSAWSQINKEKAKNLMKNGKITKRGLDSIKLAKQNGSWDKLNEVDKLMIPDDMQEFLSKNNMQHAWDSFPKSKKRGSLESLLNKKSIEARKKFLQRLFQ